MAFLPLHQDPVMTGELDGLRDSVVAGAVDGGAIHSALLKIEAARASPERRRSTGVPRRSINAAVAAELALVSTAGNAEAVGLGSAHVGAAIHAIAHAPPGSAPPTAAVAVAAVYGPVEERGLYGEALLLRHQ